MLDFLKTRAFEKKVVSTVVNYLTELHGKEAGGECAGMFATAILKSKEVGDFPQDFLERLRKDGFSIDDAALSYLDASVSVIKKVLKSESSPDIELVVSRMEKAIDDFFLMKRTRVVPRNGSAGPKMAEFSADS